MNEISAKEFGRLQAEVEGLRRDSVRQSEQLERLLEKLQQVESLLSEARGGWKVMMMVGGGAAAIGALLVKIASFFGWGE